MSEQVFPPVPGPQGLYHPDSEHDACGVGFVVNVDGRREHSIIEDGVQILQNLAHRGAAGADPLTGDGAGLMMQIPHAVLARDCAAMGFELPEPQEYAVGMVFLSPDPNVRAFQKKTIGRVVAESALGLLGWRQVPVDPTVLGPLAASRRPDIQQFFVAPHDDPSRHVATARTRAGRGAKTPSEQLNFEQRLYLLRRIAENRILRDGRQKASHFHVVSLSTRTIVYKGLMLADQIKRFYASDLLDEEAVSAFALVHQRYSTNTFPTWDLAQPFRYLGHNGEINTLRGNINWMRARQGTLESPSFGRDIKKMFPILLWETSDSCQLDNALELLLASGRGIDHAMHMLVPSAYEQHERLSPELRAFYEYHSLIQEPWDGPAAIMFSDGIRIGAVLDRNGLRPARWLETKSGRVVVASEAGVLDIPDAEIINRGRLKPGRMLLVDTQLGRRLGDREIKDKLVEAAPYGKWLDEQRVHLDDLPKARFVRSPHPEARLQRQHVFGYTEEDMRLLLAPMASSGKPAIGSMGDDAALACLSLRPRLLYDYFKQQFAQVTNPAIDPIRERMVMSLAGSLGTQRNLLGETPEHARMLQVEHPILRSSELEQIRQVQLPGFHSTTLRALYPVAEGGPGMAKAIEALTKEAEEAARGGSNIIILSDRRFGPDHAPIPALLVTSAIHHGLIRAGLRTQCSLVVETGEAREVAHFALLIGYGATCIHPYAAFEAIRQIVSEGHYVDEKISPKQASANYLTAIDKGLVKIFAKMGISTLKSYRGAQVFETIGLDRDLVDKYFTGTPSRISGIDMNVITQETAMRHQHGFPIRGDESTELDPGGHYQWRTRGEAHAWSPTSVANLQHAIRGNSYEKYQAYSRELNEIQDGSAPPTLRSLFEITPFGAPVPLDEVESARSIMQRFCTGAMSFGSISAEAHETLAISMNAINASHENQEGALGARSNSGEGGEDSARFTPDADGRLRRSAIKQVASGRFGVNSWYLTNADELQIKVAQGAKPGEGGQLPGHKVDEKIAAIRHSTPGVGLISPPPHHDIYSIEDLAQLIFDLQNANPAARVSVKLVSKSGIGTIAAGVAKGKADGIVVSGHDGGTGASPQSSIKHAGVPWELGLSEVQQTLVLNDLRKRVRLQVDGGLRTGRDVVIGALLGAEEFGFSTAPLIALGCIMMRVCHLNTCPVGIATQDPVLRRRFGGTPEDVIRYFEFVAEEIREIMAEIGVRTFDELIGRVDRLEAFAPESHWKAKHLEFSELLYRPDVPFASRFLPGSVERDPAILDEQLLVFAEPVLNGQLASVQKSNIPLRNIHRTVGTRLGYEISKRFGAQGLPEHALLFEFDGTAGQSFGAFAPRGLSLVIHGDANDYVGKGLSGGTIAVRVPPNTSYPAFENVIIGNVALYGATEGAAFFNGIAGERFAVRNSGALTVVEGVGDHACEYMTGGRVVILGPTGRNFGAGMSGGVAFAFDLDPEKCNPDGLAVLPMEPAAEDELLAYLEAHVFWTKSARAKEILADWDAMKSRFMRVVPVEYSAAIEKQGKVLHPTPTLVLPDLDLNNRRSA